MSCRQRHQHLSRRLSPTTVTPIPCHRRRRRRRRCLRLPTAAAPKAAVSAVPRSSCCAHDARLAVQAMISLFAALVRSLPPPVSHTLASGECTLVTDRLMSHHVGSALLDSSPSPPVTLLPEHGCISCCNQTDDMPRAARQTGLTQRLRLWLLIARTTDTHAHNRQVLRRDVTAISAIDLLM